tara:strand:- start:18566 stop:19807 length:1242 start_codon:yes stop_codon:yes gene_type:complete
MNFLFLKKNNTLKNYLYLSKLIIFSPFLILLVIFRFFYKIKIVEIETRAIGHYALPIEIFLCEIINEIHDKNCIYIAFRNKFIANNFLYKKIKKNFLILPRIIMEPIFWFLNYKYIYQSFGKNFISDYRHWTKNYNYKNPFQDVDIYNVLPKTPPTIKFTKNEINFGKKLLEKINLSEGDKYVCFHSRTPHYYYNKKMTNELKYKLRDSRSQNYFKTFKFLDEKNIKTVVVGENNQNSKIDSKIIYYNNSQIKNDFLDIYLLSTCRYLIGDSSGMSLVPLIFRKPIMFSNISEIHSLYTKDSIYYPLILLKKFKSLETGEYVTFSQVLEKKLSKIEHINELNKIGYEVEDNSEEEILNACEEMEHFTDKKDYLNRDDHLQDKFNKILLKYNGYELKHSKISYSFLKHNISLIE